MTPDELLDQWRLFAARLDAARQVSADDEGARNVGPVNALLATLDLLAFLGLPRELQEPLWIAAGTLIDIDRARKPAPSDDIAPARPTNRVAGARINRRGAPPLSTRERLSRVFPAVALEALICSGRYSDERGEVRRAAEFVANALQHTHTPAPKWQQVKRWREDLAAGDRGQDGAALWYHTVTREFPGRPADQLENMAHRLLGHENPTTGPALTLASAR